MEEKPGARPLMLGPWPGSGGRAGDKGKLLYTNTPVMERRWENTHAFTQNKEEEEREREEASVAIPLFKKSFGCSRCCSNVPFHPHDSLLNVPLLANASNSFLLILQLRWC